MTTLQDLGYNDQLDTFIQSQNLSNFEIGRIIRESKKRYLVRSKDGNYDGQISGRLRHEAISSSDYPAVGDWVTI